MFKRMDKNDVLDKGLSMCGRYMGSYSDACKLSLLENFEDLYGYDFSILIKYPQIHVLLLASVYHLAI